MKEFINDFGEKVTKWESYKHPDNPNFMQIVNWKIWEKKDGKILIGYNLGAGSKTIFIYNMTKEEVISKFTD